MSSNLAGCTNLFLLILSTMTRKKWFLLIISEVAAFFIFGAMSYSGDVCGPSGGWGGGSMGVDCPAGRVSTILPKNVFFWIACGAAASFLITILLLPWLLPDKTRKDKF